METEMRLAPVKMDVINITNSKGNVIQFKDNGELFYDDRLLATDDAIYNGFRALLTGSNYLTDQIKAKDKYINELLMKIELLEAQNGIRQTTLDLVGSLFALMDDYRQGVK